jgi:nitrogenase molybdenum-iron protein NifN
VPLLRAGFPQYDLLGGYQRLWVGYRGTRQTLFDLANMLVEHGHQETEPYISIYRKGSSHPNPDETTSHSTKPASGQVAGYLPLAGEGTNVKSNLGDMRHATPATGQTH